MESDDIAAGDVERPLVLEVAVTVVRIAVRLDFGDGLGSLGSVPAVSQTG